MSKRVLSLSSIGSLNFSIFIIFDFNLLNDVSILFNSLSILDFIGMKWPFTFSKGIEYSISSFKLATALDVTIQAQILELINELKERLNMSENSLMGILDMLSLMGKPVEITDVNGELVVYKRHKAKVHNTVKPPKEELHMKQFGVVSDTHYGSIWSQPSMVNTFCYEAYNRGITDMFHIGDISDGDYHTIRPDYVKHVFLYKFSFANNLSCGGKNIRHEKNNYFDRLCFVGLFCRCTRACSGTHFRYLSFRFSQSGSGAVCRKRANRCPEPGLPE